MARQVDRDRVTHIYMVRLTGTGWGGELETEEFGPYFQKGTATGTRTREVRRRNRSRHLPNDWTGEVLSAPVGEWTVES